MNRVTLHDSEEEDDTPSQDTYTPSFHEADIEDDSDILPGVCGIDQLSSDDLNLFAYPSSPIKHR